MKLRKRKGDRTVSLDEPVENGRRNGATRDRRLGKTIRAALFREEMQEILDSAVQTLKPDFPHRFHAA